MITFSSLGHHGRLGNQLFQLGLLMSINFKCNYDIVLPKDLFKRKHHGQACLLNYFKLPTVTFSDILTTNKTYNEKIPFKYDPEVFKVEDNTNFHGHFENINYIKEIREVLQKEYTIEQSIENKITNLLNKHNNPVASLHIRRGDNADGTNPTTSSLNDTNKDSVFQKYYKQALKEIPSNSVIYLFTGGSRTGCNKDDYNWCKKVFDYDNRIIFAENLNTIETFCFISKCDYNIMSFVSTFSWWGSFLNKNDNIIVPKQFNPVQKNWETKDIYLDNWLNL